MKGEERKDHWEKIYSTKQSTEFSWFQDNPTTSLELIHEFNLSKDARIIDVGGGDSRLVDKLIKEGFEDITVLDISEQAIKNAKARLGEKAKMVIWKVADITEFESEESYDLWHDRATFHFLTESEEIAKYLERARKNLQQRGFLAIGTFSNNGPKKCSGLDVRQYSEVTLENQLKSGFKKIRCLTEDHFTPSKSVQNFLFCSFRKIAGS